MSSKSVLIILTAVLAMFLASGPAHAKPTYGSNCSQCHPANGTVLPPTANAGPDQSVTEGDTVTLNGSNSTDPDDGIASYQWNQTAGTKVTLSAANASQATFTAPAVTTSSSLTFRLTVVDNSGSKATDTCIITVAPAGNPPPPAGNEPPVANAGPNKTVGETSTVTLNGSASSDPDDGIATYQWKQLDGPVVTLSNAKAVSPTFKAPSVGSVGAALTFRLTVTDTGGLKAADTCIVNVTNSAATTEPPLAKAGVDRVVNPEARVVLNGSTSTAARGKVVSYRWKQLSGVPVTLSRPASAKAGFRAPERERGAVLVFKLTVTDSAGMKDTDVVRIRVRPED